jgi:hypothetical protein
MKLFLQFREGNRKTNQNLFCIIVIQFEAIHNKDYSVVKTFKAVFESPFFIAAILKLFKTLLLFIKL